MLAVLALSLPLLGAAPAALAAPEHRPAALAVFGQVVAPPDAPPLPPRPRSPLSLAISRTGQMMMLGSALLIAGGLVGGMLTLVFGVLAFVGVLGPMTIPLVVALVAAGCLSVAVLVLGVVLAPPGIALNFVGQLVP